MGRLPARDVFDVTLTIASSPAASQAEVLDSTSDLESANAPVRATESARIESNGGMDGCSEDVDWELIADYVFKCTPTTSSSTGSALDPPAFNVQNLVPKPRTRSPPSAGRSPLARRNDTPASMSKSPTNTNAQVSATPSPTLPPQQGLSTGAKAGIASVATVGIVLLLAGLVTFHNHRRRRKYGYSRTKSKDGAAEMDGHFTVTAWPDRRGSSPMLLDGRRGSEADGIGLGIERPGGLISPGLSTGGRTPLMNDSEFNVSRISHNEYEATPNISYASTAPLIQAYTPPAQTYQSPLVPSQSRSPEVEQDPFEQHNQRTRRNHPLSLLSEAIPPPRLQPRARNSMADYQNAVPLGFANGFVQVKRDTGRDSTESTRPLVVAELENDGNERRVAELAAPNEDGPDGDPSLPAYVETEGVEERPEEKSKSRRRETVRYNASTAHYHIDSDTESEDDGIGGSGTGRRRRRSLTKEELG